MNGIQLQINSNLGGMIFLIKSINEFTYIEPRHAIIELPIHPIDTPFDISLLQKTPQVVPRSPFLHVSIDVPKDATTNHIDKDERRVRRWRTCPTRLQIL